jgi:hypothetical protein
VPGTGFRSYELYDHRSDPDENINLAGSVKHEEVMTELKAKLNAGWKAGIP